jgi:hypothetical protein
MTDWIAAYRAALSSDIPWEQDTETELEIDDVEAPEVS